MSKFIIQGGKRLEGEVKISGSKNAALPIIAATILNGGKSILENCPNIHDVEMMFKILKELGAVVQKTGNEIITYSEVTSRYLCFFTQNIYLKSFEWYNKQVIFYEVIAVCLMQ